MSSVREVAIVAVLHAVILQAVGWLLHSRRPPKEAALLVASSSGLNLGLFTYPFAEVIWGFTGLQMVVLVDLVLNQARQPRPPIPSSFSVGNRPPLLPFPRPLFPLWSHSNEKISNAPRAWSSETSPPAPCRPTH